MSEKTKTTVQCGPLMVRHIIDGHEVFLPDDARLDPPIMTEEELGRDLDRPFGGTW